MKKSFLTALCLASMVSCGFQSVVSVEHKQSPQSIETVKAKNQALRFIGDTMYFLNVPPDKVKFADFKSEKEIEAHYTALSAALKKRNPVQDASFAFNNHDRYVFTINLTSAWGGGRGDGYSLSSPYAKKLCPAAGSKLKLLEGVKFILSASGYCEGACRSYSDLSERYALAWNKVMAPLCHGGKLPK